MSQICCSLLFSEFNIVQHCMMSSLPREPPESSPPPAPSTQSFQIRTKTKRKRCSSYEETYDTFVKPKMSYLTAKGDSQMQG